MLLENAQSYSLIKASDVDKLSFSFSSMHKRVECIGLLHIIVMAVQILSLSFFLLVFCLANYIVKMYSLPL